MDGVQCGNAGVAVKMNRKTDEDEREACERKACWEPSVLSTIGKEIVYFAGHEIKIWESLDSFGSVIWPAALALCHYLDSNQSMVDLLDKAVLEIGAGTGLVSIVASLLGSWVTATDMPDVLGNLRANLCRNTRGRCRYTPQVEELTWGYELEKTFPHSVYRYDYILAADVVYHHDYLAELLVTMRHFCQPGTTLIWANKTRFGTDLLFVENFKKSFNTSLLADDGEVKIYAATAKELQSEMMHEERVNGGEFHEEIFVEHTQECENEDVESEFRELKADMEEILEMEDETEDSSNPDPQEREESDCILMDSPLVDQILEKGESTEKDKQDECNKRSWAPTIYYRPGKEVYHFMGEKITIEEALDSYGATVWPAARALCRFLETPEGRQKIDLLDKSVLELGAGTGLLSSIITLLGAKLTATDLPEILSNLTCNLNRNTRGRRKYEPQVAELFWGEKLDETFPKSTHRYDYVLATDVVYHHDYLTELMITMRHFCQPGTTLVWANKLRYARDLGFIDDFFRYFDARLLEELDDVRIYVGTCRGDHHVQEMKDEEGNHVDIESDNSIRETEHDDVEDELECVDDHRLENDKQDYEEPKECGRFVEHEELKEAEPVEPDPPEQRSWAPTVYYSLGKEIYSFLGHDIKIQESIDHYGGVVWPAALALCRFLDTQAGQQQISLLDKSTLELGAGTGLVSIMATLLGAKVTATDLPEILGNLRCNVNRNTRGWRRHEPQVSALQWGHRLEQMFPRSLHHYDYILAADTVYHHDCLRELLQTLQHFCQTGTTVILANKLRYQSDRAFIRDFQKAFNTTLLTEMEEVRIYSATI
ncbi:uncharacterized protein LOC130233792 [Danio aesculapii]|uniref:uncharacterized protein LOC130233792 n=1 Tax=Danio aesculapii TaxID=1142201 RepID=UPI0024C09373|nr:uncharacterized protein LOC130233792 [Danio aesculapii]XP_056319989.1 uncharacterized protein LOC130233792 [Danio aesculapii]